MRRLSLLACLLAGAANASEDIPDQYPQSVLYAKPYEVIPGVFSAIGATAPPTYENAGHNNNLSFIVTGDGVIVVNSGASWKLAEALHGEIRAGYVSVVTDCPFDGPTPPAQVARVAAALRDLGCYEISLGDTIGHGRPETIRAMLQAVLAELPPDRLAGHYHDTQGRALANIEASLDLGLRVFDAAVGGLGGCPYAPGAAGNVATEAVAARLAALGLATGLDAGVLVQAAGFARSLRGQGQIF